MSTTVIVLALFDHFFTDNYNWPGIATEQMQHSWGHVIKACAIIYYNCIFFLLSCMVNVLKFQTLPSFCPPMVTSPRGYKTFYMLNSIEHEISTAHKK